jgi:hypothetical protein
MEVSDHRIRLEAVGLFRNADRLHTSEVVGKNDILCRIRLVLCA